MRPAPRVRERGAGVDVASRALVAFSFIVISATALYSVRGPVTAMIRRNASDWFRCIMSVQDTRSGAAEDVPKAPHRRPRERCSPRPSLRPSSWEPMASVRCRCVALPNLTSLPREGRWLPRVPRFPGKRRQESIRPIHSDWCPCDSLRRVHCVLISAPRTHRVKAATRPTCASPPAESVRPGDLRGHGARPRLRPVDDGRLPLPHFMDGDLRVSARWPFRLSLVLHVQPVPHGAGERTLRRSLLPVPPLLLPAVLLSPYQPY